MKNYLVRVTKEVTDYLVVNADNENVAHFIAEGFAEGRIDVNDPHFKEYMRNIGFNYVPKEISIEDSSDGTLKDCAKTTLLNALLTTIPDNKRVFTIEFGSRELALVRKDESGFVTNNVVHTLSRPSDNEAYDITQEDLVVASLRFNPDIVCVGEMRDVECYSAVEASLTGHTVVSTVHAFAADAAHMRIALLCQKRFPIDFKTSLMQAGQAFPIVVYTHKLENNDRKIMDISECEILPNGDRLYHTLFRYHITKNDIVDGRFVTEPKRGCRK